MPDAPVQQNAAAAFLERMQHREDTEAEVLAQVITFARVRECSLHDAVDILALDLGRGAGMPSGSDRERQQRFRTIGHGFVEAYKVRVEAAAWAVAFRPTAPPAPATPAQVPLLAAEQPTRHPSGHRSVLETAERIHGAVTGTGDDLPEAELAELVAWLRERIGTRWDLHSPAEAPGQAYDEAVRSLAREAVFLGQQWLDRVWPRKAAPAPPQRPQEAPLAATRPPYSTEAIDALRARLREAEGAFQGCPPSARIESVAASLRAELAGIAAAAPREPLDCPSCGKRHVDFGQWASRLHRTHRCVNDPAGNGCGHTWELDHYAFGVRFIRFWACPTEGCHGGKHVTSNGPGRSCPACHAALVLIRDPSPGPREHCHRPGCDHSGASHTGADGACGHVGCGCVTFMYPELARAHSFVPLRADATIDVCRCNVERRAYTAAGAAVTRYQYRWAFPGHDSVTSWVASRTPPPCQTVLACIVCRKPIKPGQRTANDAEGRPTMHRKCSPMTPAKGGGR